MLAVGTSSQEVGYLLKKVKKGKVIIACINGPSLVTASGDKGGILELQGLAEAEDIFVRRLQVDVAYHSHHMKDVAEAYREKLGHVAPERSQSGVHYYSSLYGQRTDTSVLGTDYWVDNLTNPVLFHQALEALCVQGQAASSNEAVDTLLEIGPHSAMKAPIKDTLKANRDLGNKIKYLTSMSRNQNAGSTLLSTVCELFSAGYPVNLSQINNDFEPIIPRKVLGDLPSYPWIHKKRHWHESRLSRNHRFRRFPKNDLLGVLVDDWNEIEPRWRKILRTSEIPWLHHHKVQSSTVFPLAGYISIIIEAASQLAIIRGSLLADTSKYNIREITVLRSLVLNDSTDVELSIVARASAEGTRSNSGTWDQFTIYSWNEEAGWSEHCRGFVSVLDADTKINPVNGQRNLDVQKSDLINFLKARKIACTTSVDCDLYYQEIAKIGLEFGPTFQGLCRGLTGPGQCIGTVVIPDSAKSMPRKSETNFIIHPATLDACLQSASLAIQSGNLEFSALYVPTFVKALSVSHGISKSSGDPLEVHSTAKISRSGREAQASYVVIDPTKPSHEPVIEISGFISSALSGRDEQNEKDTTRGLCYAMNYDKCIDLLSPDQYSAANFPATGLEPQGRAQTKMAERAAFYIAQAALESLSDSDVEGLEGHFKKLYGFLKRALNQGTHKKDLPFQTSDWLGCSSFEVESFLKMERLSDDVGRLVCETGKNLAKIFLGQVEPLSVMLNDNLLEGFYRDNVSLTSAYIKCASWIEILGHQNPHMRILEIGAGTGSATVHVLEVLGKRGPTARFGHYEYTDISSGFFERARERLNDWGELIGYSKLDIEQDPVLQGFEAESYDLIIASEVLHATTQIQRTMENVRKLIKPGGKLVIVETTTLTMFHNVIFGTLPGKNPNTVQKSQTHV